MATSVNLVSGNGVELPPLIGDLYAPFEFTAATPGPAILIPAVPGKSFLVTRLFVQIDLLATKAASGNVFMHFEHIDSDGATVIQEIGKASVYVPQNTPAIGQAQIGSVVSSGTGYWYRSQKQNTSVRVHMDNGPLTAGSIRVAVNYAYNTVFSS